MKLGLEVDPQADHPPLGSDRNPRFYLLRNTGLVDANLFCFPLLGIEGHKSRPDRRHHGHLSPVESKS